MGHSAGDPKTKNNGKSFEATRMRRGRRWNWGGGVFPKGGPQKKKKEPMRLEQTLEKNHTCEQGEPVKCGQRGQANFGTVTSEPNFVAMDAPPPPAFMRFYLCATKTFPSGPPNRNFRPKCPVSRSGLKKKNVKQCWVSGLVTYTQGTTEAGISPGWPG